MKEPPTLELVLKRNSVERLKREKSPLGILDELPALIAPGYEQRRRGGHRPAASGGASTTTSRRSGRSCCASRSRAAYARPTQLRAIGEISNRVRPRRRRARRRARTSSCTVLSSRSCRTSSTACDARRPHHGRRLRRHRPQHHRLPACRAGARRALRRRRRCVDEAADALLRQPGLLRPAAQAQVSRSPPAPTAAPRPRSTASRSSGRSRRRRREGFGVLVGGGPLVGAAHRPRPRRLGAEGGGGRGARRDHRRVARGPALPRLARQGAPEVHDRRHRRRRACASASRRGSAARFDDFELPPAPPPPATTSASMSSSDGALSVGVPVHLGLITGDQMIALADLAERSAATSGSRASRTSSLTGVPDGRACRRGAGSPRSASRSTPNPLRGDAIACTGEPHCNFSVTETKTRMDGLVRACSRSASATTIAGLRLHLDGCPHACAQHWVGDLGFQGTTVRDEDGARRQAYDIFVRGGLDRPAPRSARPVFRRVPTDELDAAVVRPRRGLARSARRRTRSFRVVLRPHDRRRPRRPRRPRAGRARETGGRR